MRIRLVLAALAAAAVLQSSAAQADCSASKNDFEDVYCGAKNFIDADGDLNAAYKALVEKLDAGGKSVLKKSQVTWMKSRNDQCGKTDSDGYYVDLDCAVETTRNRAQFLKDRTAECDAGKCDLDRMAEVQ
ncbi:MAG TPA: lysozyme inhibitor LprI family protein [Candidatus Cybelea sp.]|nr:lysozyme inhibitor LprI family protein [Candidatus Cybelea sp.]